MKIILPIIVLLIILILSIIIFNNNIYFSEDFVGSYNQNTIEDLIPISYVPSNPYLIKKTTEYEVIDIYKKVLLRSPSADELELKTFLTKDELTEELYNSYEYDRLIKIQDNLAINDIEKTIAHNNLIKKVVKLYKENYNKEPDSRMLSPLSDCYIHLRSNIFLFLVFLQSKNFIKFETDILSTKNLTKVVILEIFNTYFNLLELKLLAEDKIRTTRGDLSLSVQTNNVNYNSLHDELSRILTTTSNSSNLLTPTSTSIQPVQLTSNINTSELLNYLTSSQINTSNVVEPFENKREDKKLSVNGVISDIYKNTLVGNIYK
jgi:hypothetical protein